MKLERQLMLLSGTVLAAAIAAACSSSSDTTTSSPASSASASSTSGTGGMGGATSSSSSSTSSSGGGGSGGGAAMPSFVAHFDPMKGELAEGLFVKGNTAYVGYAALGKIVTVDIDSGAIKDFGSIPPIPMNGGFMLGIVVDGAGNVFVGFGGGPGMAVKNGVYKLPPAGGAVTNPFSTDPAMNFANGLVLDSNQTLFVADSGGAIFKIAANGTATKWAADPALVGTDMTCKYAAPFPIGANGIVQIGSAFYVSNTNLGSIVKIPINGDGSAGTATVLAGPDCDALGGIDGIAVDKDGTTILGVSNSQNKLVKIDAAGKVTVAFSGKPLDNPASTFTAKHGAGTSLFITNSAFFDMAAPQPGLLEYPL